MARTLHQAMAYLGLAENEDDRRGQTLHQEEVGYQESQVWLGEEEATSPQEEEVYERDTLRGLQEAQLSPQTSTTGTASIQPEEELIEILAPAQSPAMVAPAPLAPYTPPTLDESSEELRRITTIHPRSYNDAKIIGESFRENIPVIMNVTDMGENEAKRLVDFSAGLAFALHGSIERVTDKVFLLTPANLEVLGAEGAEVPVALDGDDSVPFNQL